MKRIYTFEEFLTQADPTWITKSPIWWFSVPADVPILFFSYVRSRIKLLQVEMQTIDFNETEASSIVSRLQTSFLGSSLLYWSVSLFDEIDRKKQSMLSALLADYSGPHTVIVYSSSEYQLPKEYAGVHITVPQAIDQHTFLLLARFIQVTLSSRALSLLPTIFKKYERISIDQACILLWYLACVGVSCAEFVEKRLSKIFLQDSSLFTLSQFFFAKDSQQFFNYWKEIGASYPETFWVSYWSEQVWRAHFARAYLQQNNQLEAKKIGYRLPFSFLQKDWKKHSAQQLMSAHDQLYHLDYALKNGGPEFGLELFYHQFFNQ